MFELLSWGLKYILIILIYLFIFRIIHLIYMDIKTMHGPKRETEHFPYLKLINRRDRLDFHVRESYLLDKQSVTFGRSQKCDVVIQDPYISGVHAKFIEDEGIYFVEDLHSANGTYVNGVKIEDVTPLKDGDRISMGQVDFLFVKGSK